MSVEFNPSASGAYNPAVIKEQLPQYNKEEFLKTLDADSDDETVGNTDLSKDWSDLCDELDVILKDSPAVQETLVKVFMGTYLRNLPKDQVKLKRTCCLLMQDILPMSGADGLAGFYAALDQAPKAQEIIKTSKFATLFGIK